MSQTRKGFDGLPSDSKSSASLGKSTSSASASGSPPTTSQTTASRALSPPPQARTASETAAAALRNSPQSPPATVSSPKQKAEWGDSIENLSRLALSSDEGDQLTVRLLSFVNRRGHGVMLVV